MGIMGQYSSLIENMVLPEARRVQYIPKTTIKTSGRNPQNRGEKILAPNKLVSCAITKFNAPTNNKKIENFLVRVGKYSRVKKLYSSKKVHPLSDSTNWRARGMRFLKYINKTR